MRASVKNAATLERSWKRWGKPFSSFMNRLNREGVSYLSHSKISALKHCPLCFYNQYILGEKLDSEAIKLGSLFHAVAEKFYTALALGQSAEPGTLLKKFSLNSLEIDSRTKLKNALATLRNNRWEGYEIVSVEDPFFIDLAVGLPPVIGITDLVLKRGRTLLLVDHKTSKKFSDLDPNQLVLYAEYIRRRHDKLPVIGVFDEYRLVSDISTARKPVFRRTPVAVDRTFLPSLVREYRDAWKKIKQIERDGAPPPSPDCWKCNSYSFY